MKIPSFLHFSGTRILEALIWYGFLTVLACLSFINDFYSSQLWLLVTACVYGLSLLCVFSVAIGGRFNRSALASAKVVLIVLSSMLLLLLMQMHVPLARHTELLLLDNALYAGNAPAWFDPKGVWSIVPQKTRWLLHSEVLMFTVFTLSIVLVFSRRRLKQLLSVLLIVGLTHSSIGIIAKYAELTLVEARQLDGHFTVARGMFINRNHFASFVSLCMIGALVFQIKALFSQDRAGFSGMLIGQFMTYRIVFPLSLTVGLIALVLSQSRAGFLALIVSLFSVLIFANSRKRKLSGGLSIGVRKLSLLAVLVALVVAIVLAYFGNEVLLRLTSGSLLGERVEQWSLTWLAIEQSWLLGYGGNSYADVFQIHRDTLDFRQVVFNQAHNDYLHIWLEQGLLGLSLWIGLLVLVLRNALDGLNKTRSSLVRATLISVLVVLLAALLQSAVDFNLQILNIRTYFFVIMSLAFSVPAIRQRKISSEKSVVV